LATGRTATSGPAGGHEAELAILLGRKIHGTAVVDRARPPVLSVRAASTAADYAETPLREVSFDVWSGEVLGIAGVDGNGQKHLAEMLAGQRGVRRIVAARRRRHHAGTGAGTPPARRALCDRRPPRRRHGRHLPWRRTWC
jgi:ABC-type uncharacterized transport system ATPase subunit